MENRLNRIEESLQKLLVLTERNTVSLEEHMRRTTLLESIVEVLRTSVTKLEKNSVVINTIWKFAVTIGGVLLALNQLASLLDKLR